MSRRRRKDFIIYGLVDPRTKEVRYIGQSINGIRRLQEHASAAKRGEKGRKANWIRSLQRLGLSFKTVIIERTERDKLNEREKFWISIYKSFCDLTNISDGGDSDIEALTKRVITPAERQKRSENAKARWAVMSEEDKAAFIQRGQKALKELPHDFRSEVARAREAAKPPEFRRKVMKKAFAAAMANSTHEERSARAKVAAAVAVAAVSMEERKERGRHMGLSGWGKLTAEQRSERAKHASAAVPTEVRREWGFGHRSIQGSDIQRAIEMRDNKQSLATIAKVFGCSLDAVKTALKGVK